MKITQTFHIEFVIRNRTVNIVSEMLRINIIDAYRILNITTHLSLMRLHFYKS